MAQLCGMAHGYNGDGYDLLSQHPLEYLSGQGKEQIEDTLTKQLALPRYLEENPLIPTRPDQTRRQRKVSPFPFPPL